MSVWTHTAQTRVVQEPALVASSSKAKRRSVYLIGKTLGVSTHMGVEEVQENSHRRDSEALWKCKLIYFGSLLYLPYWEYLLTQVLDKYLLGECSGALPQLSHFSVAVIWRWELFIAPFSTEGNQGVERCSDLPWVTQLRIGGATSDPEPVVAVNVDSSEEFGCERKEGKPACRLR